MIERMYVTERALDINDIVELIRARNRMNCHIYVIDNEKRINIDEFYNIYNLSNSYIPENRYIPENTYFYVTCNNQSNLEVIKFMYDFFRNGDIH